MFLCAYYALCSIILLLPALLLFTPIPEKLLSARGFWRADTLARARLYQRFLFLLWGGLTAATAAVVYSGLFQRLKPPLKAALFALALPIITLVMVEAAGRIIVGLEANSESLYVDHPYLMIVPKPGAKLGKITINSEGYRGKEILSPKPEKVFRVICLGGSTTFADYVSDDETWCAQIESILNQRAPGNKGPRVETINAGVPGYTTVESLINLNLRLLDLKPNAIILYHSYNDFKPNRFPGFASDYSHWRRPFGKVNRPLINRYSVSPRLVSDLLERLRPRMDFGFKRYDTVDEPGVEAFKRNLADMAAVAKARGIRVMLSSEASLLSPLTLDSYPAAFNSGLKFVPTLSAAGLLDAQEQYDKAIKEVARQFDATYVDNLHLVPKDFDHFVDHIHLTAKGCRSVAENFVEAIEKRRPKRAK